MNTSHTEAVSKIVQMHLDSSKIYQKVIHDAGVEDLSAFFSDFHKMHETFAKRLQEGSETELLEDLVERAPLLKQEEELFAAADTDNEVKIYEICLSNERQIMKCYEEALTVEEHPSKAFKKNLDTISTIVRRLERAKTVPSIKNILVDL